MDLSLSVFTRITHILEENCLEYAVVGSFASSIHGLYRATADIDILANISSEQVATLFNSLKEIFYVDELAIRDAVTRRGSFNAIHFEAVFKVDFFVAGADRCAQSQLARRELRSMSPAKELELYVATAEDTILAKLKWYRAGNEVSNSQWNDVLSVIGAAEGKLDLIYLQRWATDLGVSDLLEKAMRQS